MASYIHSSKVCVLDLECASLTIVFRLPIWPLGVLSSYFLTSVCPQLLLNIYILQLSDLDFKLCSNWLSNKLHLALYH